MGVVSEMLAADFLLRNALVASMLLGVMCPMVGVYFVLRRMIFLGVALPQLSAAGVAFAFLVGSALGLHVHGTAQERIVAAAGAFGFTMLGLLALAALERLGRETIDSRIGVTYAAAAAAGILFVVADPHGEAEMANLLKGDVVTTTGAGALELAGVFLIVLALLVAFRRDLLLVSFDREMARVLGKRVAAWDALLYLLIGLTISFGVMTAGPLLTFGFLVIPPLTARLLTRHMGAFTAVAAGAGALSAFVGFACAYRFDLPLGPTDVAVSLVVFAAVALGRAVHSALRPPLGRAHT
ncbi:MAG TPA: metal ABC transporter permease [Candidatus Binatia bacterium]|nr:metal ABC transporter permease [Candidatus Binatia bacterium]